MSKNDNPKVFQPVFIISAFSMNYLYRPVTSLNTDTMITSFISKYVEIEYFFFFRIRVTMKWYGAYMQSDLIGQIQFTILIYVYFSHNEK